MAVPEEAVLKPTVKPKNSALINSDDWPIFTLRKGRVVSQDNGEQVSLLSAHKGHKVKVTGQLMAIEDELQPLVRDPHYRLKTIELTDVTTYAFAEYLDGTYGFWAAGKAGWFEFDSFASSYQHIHNQMSEASSLMYTLADRLRKSKVSGQASMEGRSLNKYMLRVLRDCLSQAGNPARFSDVEDVREAFHEHRIFLITCMLEGQEGLDWLGTPLFAYFKKTFPGDVATLTARILPASVIPAPKVPASNIEAMPPSRKRRSESPHVTEPKTKKKKGRTMRHSPIPAPLTPPSKILKEDEPSEEDYDDPNVITHKRKSFLRPSGGKSAKKVKTAVSTRRSLPALDQDGNSEDEQLEEATPPLDDFPITTIKNGEHLDLITNPQGQLGDVDSQDHASPPRFLPRKYLELSVAEYEIPSTEPQGPGGLWTCNFEGCGARVHQADRESGQEKVKEHLRTHITNTKEKIDLVLDESRPYLPVNNLVRRLQAFATPLGEEPAPDSIERTFSAPIRRKY